ncbi:MAG TPA: InlB B-repeat-containing protein, partial [Bacilli bacterium]
MNKRIIIVILFFLFLLTACFEKKYQITFDTLDDVVVVKEGESFSLPTPERVGYKFDGWYLDNNYQQPFTKDSIVDKDIKLYAKWEVKQYKITLETGEEIILDYQEEIELNEPTKEGYTFGGWFEDYKYTKALTFDKMPAYDLTLYAKWDINSYEVTFDSNGGTEIAKQTIPYGKVVVKPSNPQKQGYHFMGWYLDEELSVEYDFKRIVKSDLTLYAK